jgi:hypothetical protein
VGFGFLPAVIRLLGTVTDCDRIYVPIQREGEDMNKILLLSLVFVLALSVASCTPGPNELRGTRNADGTSAGLLLGLWHGLISPITFIISLFSRKVNIYEVHNSGAWYNFGFVLGAGLFLSGGILGHKKTRK